MTDTIKSRFTVGMTATWRGQEYQLIEIRPHRNRTGHDTIVLAWQSPCLACGAPFTTTTTRAGLKYPNRRCPEHVQTRCKQPS
jgi:hypothetical protein